MLAGKPSSVARHGKKGHKHSANAKFVQGICGKQKPFIGSPSNTHAVQVVWTFQGLRAMLCLIPDLRRRKTFGK